jgi:hypothetical protein
MFSYRLVELKGRAVGDATYATEIHPDDVVLADDGREFRVVAIAQIPSDAAPSAVLIVSRPAGDAGRAGVRFSSSNRK